MSTPGRKAVRVLALARFISVTGDSAAKISLAYVLYHETGSSLWVAALFLVTSGLNGILLPFAGGLADRTGRKRLMVLSEFAGAGVYLVLATATTPVAWVAIMAVGAVVETPFYASSSAAIPNLVDDEADLSWANSLRMMSSMGGIIVGPVLGGVLVATLGAPAVFLMNAVTYVVSALLIMRVRGAFEGKRDEDSSGEHRGALAGFRFIRAHPYLFPLVTAWTIWYFTVNISWVADVPLAAQFGVGSVGYGLFSACWGVGALIGSFLGRKIEPGREPTAILLAACVVTIAYLSIGLFASYGMVLGLLLGSAAFDLRGSVAQGTLLQRLSPDAVRGRVFAAEDSLGQLANVVAYVFAGVFAASLGPQGLYVAGGVAVAISAIILFLARKHAPTVAAPGQAPGQA